MESNFSVIVRWISILLLCLLLGSIGLGWVVKSALIIIGVVILIPIIAALSFGWWYYRNVGLDECPSCGEMVYGMNNREFTCPHCKDTLTMVNRTVQRVSPLGTIDVTAVEVEN
jgi:predicted RNA-binding Zn-ribbon protein involved in translation (DUF1610 family)